MAALWLSVHHVTNYWSLFVFSVVCTIHKLTTKPIDQDGHRTDYKD